MKIHSLGLVKSFALTLLLLPGVWQQTAQAQRETTKEISVQAKYASGENGWLDSGFNVTAGGVLNIDADGRWNLGGQNLETNADGLTNYPDYRGYRYGALLGRIGSNGNPFLIGSRFSQRFDRSGRLYLSNNDSVAGDNSGALRLRISCSGCGGRESVGASNMEKTFSVSSRYINETNNWFKTGVYVHPGAGLGIAASGIWQLGRNEYNTDANGLENFKLNRGQRFGALLGRIGENGQEFLIGERFVQKANSSGYLYLANNDTVADDNSGELNVVVQCNGCSDTPPRLSTLPAPPTPITLPENPGPGAGSYGQTKQDLKVSARYVSGNREWLDSGVVVKRKSQLSITARGRWRINTWGKAVDANGGGDYAEYERLPYGALVGRIGQNGKTFLIGTRYEERVRKGGRLFLANNDDVGDDNEGELIVSISCDRCGSQNAGPGDDGNGDGKEDEYAPNQPNADFLIARKWRMVDESGYLVAKRVVLRRDGSVRTRGAVQDIGVESWRMGNGSLVLLNGRGNVVNRFTFDGSPGGQAVYRGRGYNSRQANYVLIEIR